MSPIISMVSYGKPRPSILASQSRVVYETKGVSKVDVGYVYVLKGVFYIFQGYNLCLYLSCSLSLWVEAFLVVV